MMKGLLFACLVMLLHQQTRCSVAINFDHGVRENELFEWKGEVAHIRRPSSLYVTHPLPNNQYYSVMKMQIQGARRILYFQAGYRSHERYQGNCTFTQDESIILPKKPFRIILRFTSRSIMVYLNGNLVFTQPFEISNANVRVRLEKIVTIRTYHTQRASAEAEVFRLLSDEMLANEMQVDGCGTIKSGRRIPIPPFCEKRTRTTNNFRIVGGVPAYPGQTSWQVAIRKKPQFVNPNANPHVCGATLVGSCWVISAAHCFLSTSPTSLKRLVIRVGDYYNQDGTQYSSVAEFEQSRDVNIRKVFRHPKYQSYPASKNDIALVRLDECVSFNTFVKPACLPVSENQFPERTLCGISGWGASNETEHTTDYPKCLQTAQVSIKTNRRCRRSFGNKFNETIMMCAGKSDVDACLGDSGGPLICSANSEEVYTLWGITSWGIGCGDINHPGVYTRLSTYIRWIYMIMKLSPDDKTLTDRIRGRPKSRNFCQRNWNIV